MGTFRNLRFAAFCLQALLLFSVSVLVTQTSALAAPDYTRYVNPFIGTSGHGHTFPGATTPFGMVQLSPDTRIDNWDGSSGYHYSDNEIFGFSHTHLSGTGIPDYCDILVTPTIDGNSDRTFYHSNETATAGFYSVKMNNGIAVELTSTPRVGLHKYEFPKAKFANITIDLKWRDTVLDSEVEIVGDRRVEGFRRSSSWAKDQLIYFVAEFSEPFVSHAVAYDGLLTEQSERVRKGKGTNLSAHLRFRNPKKRKILVRVALSPVSIEGARKNLKAELDHWNFEEVRSDAKSAWNKELSKIEVKGGTSAQMTNFYTALYHALIQPNIFQDVDGTYRGMDGVARRIGDGGTRGRGELGEPTLTPERETLNPSPTQYSALSTQNLPPDANYTVFSLWDTFRAAHPLYTIIDEKRTVEFINTFIRQYEQGGKLPVWELAGNETDTMIGYNAVSVIADAMSKGIEGFDYEKAYKAAKHSAELNIEGLDSFRERGYISMEDEQESVSRTLEYAYNSYCVAVIGELTAYYKVSKSAPQNGPPAVNMSRQAMLDPIYEESRVHLARAQYYKNLFDKETGFMRPKQNGNWISPFAPNEVTFHFTEANSWQYSFFVPHDVNGLIDLYGGTEKFAAKLDALFTADSKTIGREQPDITGLIGQYAHGNEPSHHIAYLYNFAGQPWKTQYYVRKIMDEFYKPEPDGLIGNEDCGQMSAWYILSALGFYQVNPSVPEYSIGTPLFDEAKIHLENGKSFVVKRSGTGKYVRSVKLRGADHHDSSFLHRDIQTGGELEFEMSEEPVKNWFRISTVSQISNTFPVVPTISGERVFEKDTKVTISKPLEGNIYYTLDGIEPTALSNLYEGPFVVDKTTTVKAITVSNAALKSLTAESVLTKLPHDWDVKLESTYNRQYTGGGPKGLIDGLRGTTNFASGEWQGYQDQDFVVVIDLKREQDIEYLGAGFLQVARSWIWMPKKLEFETSVDGISFEKVLEFDIDFPEREMEHSIRDYSRKIPTTRARFVRIKATNLGVIPAWHPGAGFQAFIFVDEVFIK